ncbi:MULTISPECIES: phosphonate metabolism protein/1,5-bisphosphokinase (PRPP-forming) PhnN [Rhodopseudomonas]|uniref:Ribose 1,5-bisphosphate phosphokinase PhnN n=1 Tax=Rhodopseudomonas palustris TaxID=1076 RepID=A0A0D7EV16_RHOPL|nr:MULTISPECIES: phosphonate metabolism protein/1,5-bisphosphokinase (PRPP-forming) PhnN [Rhodopseudomonas]KIZ44653.1 ribose-phosphate pyrophosphokinase [Rhodopseudomonas palustris]MDF3810931.1 phosphonate metabolism protein/1,5-bisphosphokinase (PRPP-forming) PhnN [Rhodopseudomonas sp. BAL398]WOK20824.1 phosphonate metabolism protein/1,5-bisphosphokinase (PRPP-forming) PhnN [Rhodopseudomonas sp. BAL398]
MSRRSPGAVGGLGPGRLILIVGPSGAGKDTLIALAQQACAGDPRIQFVRRVVTREASAFENNETVTPQAFRQAVAQGAFALHWEAHGHCYGLSKAIDGAIRAGQVVVANVSRMVIAAARAAYADVVVVSVTAPPEILAQRLAARARASDGRLDARLNRDVNGAAPDVTIVNVGPAEANAETLLRVIRGA